MDERYTPISRTTITSKAIPQLVMRVMECIKSSLVDQKSISVTADIWSDRTMRSYTAHVLNSSSSGYTLKAYLLECRRCKGRHSSENISAAFDEILDDSEDDSEDEEDDGWGTARYGLSSWFPSTAILLCPQFSTGYRGWDEISKGDVSSMLKNGQTFHAVFKDRFEAVFGSGKSIPVSNVTRWNSQFRQIQAVIELDYTALTQMCSVDFENVVLSSREWAQCRELTLILGPFAEATQLTEGDQIVTISMAVPTVLELHSHLKDLDSEKRLCRPLTRALRAIAIWP
ncbi:hypothetical protein N1851_010714 [Merluccius polli]|uniref:Uncharacterized protein n=1 Tax=Merluccius polli TaxID=89951 RepID=A0AA47MZA8_MERPO|nr:hypothetical protein N1851_010714 [Merluccius polli]